MRPKNKLKFFKLPLIAAFLFAANCMSAQNFTISGTVKDSRNGEDLIGAIVSVKEDPAKGAATNAYGFYSLTLPKGNYTLLYQFLGYLKEESAIVLDKDIILNIQIGEEPTTTSEVLITGEKVDKNVRSTEMGVTRIDPKSVESVPVLFGERDIIKIFQMTPGVKSAGEGSSGFYVRGGGSDQNLILLDEAPVYNASHLLGFFSVFNSDALKDVTLYKGGMPAEYGGRASSVMDIKMKDGNSKKFGASGGIGLISSRLTLEAPIVKDKGSFMISGRRTYADVFLKLSKDENTKKSILYFYDFNIKSNYKFNEKNRLYLSGYFGRDNFGLADVFGFDWGNSTGTLRWNHIFNEKLFSNTSVIYSDYSYRFKFNASGSDVKFTSSIRDWNLKQDFSYFPNPNNKIKYGANAIYHTFVPGEVESDYESFTDTKLTNRYALEGGVYLQNDQSITEFFGIQYGLRYSYFNYLGEGKAYTFDDEGNKTSETSYGSWESIKTYGGFEPRVSLKYELTKASSIKASFNRAYQYLHLLSNSTSSQPTDIWVPSSNNIKPQIADQVSAGYFRNFKDNAYEFSIEGYYKLLSNQIDYRNGADLFFNDEAEGQLVFGKGRAYGAEFFLRKQSGNFTGWISYTWSRSLRTFDDINEGSEYPSRQDRIHDLAIVAMYKINDRIRLSANWVYYTGSAVTFPSGKYEIGGVQVPYYTERNGYRMPAYHRMDAGITIDNDKTKPRKRPRKFKDFDSNWNISVYNLYARENAYSITFRANEDNPQQMEAVRTALFKIVPSVTYNFSF
jgi:TonB dependent receptor/CarboxypepD_reg-like domain/TonB-dependent Receptor Plug Domain